MPTTPPTITPLSTPPSTNDPTNFDSRADAYLAHLAGDFTDDLEAVADNVYDNAVEAEADAVAANASAAAALASQGQAATSATAAATSASTAAAALANVYAQPSTYATSTTSLTVGTGAKSLTIESGKTLTAGQIVVVESVVDPRAWMLGAITSYSGTALAFTSSATGGAGTFASWRISLLGALPISGRQGQALTWDNGRPVWGRKVRRLGASTNVLLHNNDPTNAAWTKYGSPTLALANIVGPFGAVDGWRFTQPSADSYIYQSPSTTAGDLYTLSFFVLAGSAAEILVQVGLVFMHVAPSTGACRLSNGVDEAVDFGAVSDGGGWWRCWVTVRATGSSLTFYVFPNNRTANTDFTYYFGHQLQPGRLGAYVPTTGAAASGGGVLRPDLLTYSEQVDTSEGSAPWQLSTLPGVTRVGKSVSPIGTLRATEYTPNSSGAVTAQYSFVTGRQYTIGLWGRKSSSASLSGHSLVYTNAVGAGAQVIPLSVLTEQWGYYEASFVSDLTGALEIYLLLYATGPNVHLHGFRIAEGPTARYTLPNVAGLHAGASEMLTLNTQHAIDSAAAAITVAPPDGMKPGDWFEIADDGGSAAANNITLLRGPYPAIAGAAEDFVIDINNWSGRFLFDPAKGLVLA